jgi:hypothetical protein
MAARREVIGWRQVEVFYDKDEPAGGYPIKTDREWRHEFFHKGGVSWSFKAFMQFFRCSSAQLNAMRKTVIRCLLEQTEVLDGQGNRKRV